MERNVSTISLELPRDMKEEIQTAIKCLFFHNNSELVRAGIRMVLDDVRMKKQTAEQTGNDQV
jgi:Arc/MetJ-type ribon-helix-helix transcriptional regulator